MKFELTSRQVFFDAIHPVFFGGISCHPDGTTKSNVRSASMFFVWWRDILCTGARPAKTPDPGAMDALQDEDLSAEMPGHEDEIIDEGFLKFKGITVFRGNNVKDENAEQALFAELGSAPSTMKAAKAIDGYGAMPGNRTQRLGGRQTYTQALHKGVKTS